MISGIYVITNIKTRRFYVGSSKDVKSRFQQWSHDAKNKKLPKKMLEDLKATSPGDFIFKLVRECRPSGASLDRNEKEVIKLLEEKYPDCLYNYQSPARNHKPKAELEDERIRDILRKGKRLNTSRFSKHGQLKYEVGGISAYELAIQNGISNPLLYTRINKYGWDEKRACTEPPRKYPEVAKKDRRRKC